MLLCDSPGMGKTITAAGLVLQIKSLVPETKALIVCNKVLMSNWRLELDKWTVTTRTITFDKNEKVCVNM